MNFLSPNSWLTRWLVLACFLASWSFAPLALASAWNPTLLVNTEAFQTIDDQDTAADVVVQFGDTIAKSLTYERTAARFSFDDDLHIQNNLTASGTLSIEGAATFQSSVTLNGITYTFPGSDGSNGYALTTNGGGTLSWTDVSGGGGLTVSQGDERYTLSAGDTMTGDLTIANGSALAISGSVRTDGNLTINDNNTALDATLTFGNDAGTEFLRFSDLNNRFEFSDDVYVADTILTDSNLTINNDNGAVNAVLTFGNDAALETLQFVDSLERFEFSDDLHVTNNLSASGTLAIEGNANIDGTTLFVESNTDEVGMGTSDPDGILHLDNGASNTELVIEKDDATIGRIQFQNDGAVSGYVGMNTVEALVIENELSNRDIVFNTLDGSVNKEMIRIDGNESRVGIGTSVPGSELSVSGAVIIGNNLGSAAAETQLEVIGSISGSSIATAGNLTFMSNTGNTGTLDHAITSARTWTLPDATTTIVGTDTSQTLTNKTISADNNVIRLSGALVWYVDGTLAVGTAQSMTFTLPVAFTPSGVEMQVDTAPTGASLIVDINEGGTTIFSTRPEVDAGATTEDGNHVFSDTSLAAGSEISIDIDQIGSTVAGDDITIQLHGSYSQ